MKRIPEQQPRNCKKRQARQNLEILDPLPEQYGVCQQKEVKLENKPEDPVEV